MAPESDIYNALLKMENTLGAIKQDTVALRRELSEHKKEASEKLKAIEAQVGDNSQVCNFIRKWGGYGVAIIIATALGGQSAIDIVQKIFVD